MTTQLKIADTYAAYVACSLASTAIVITAGCLALALNIVFHGLIFDAGSFFGEAFLIWLAISAGVLFTAWPFVFAATWAGPRLGLESAAYYIVTGGVTTAVIITLLNGFPQRPNVPEFGLMDNRIVWVVSVCCGAMWGASWWYLHRRWNSPAI